jgi:hypothetical protein
VKNKIAIYVLLSLCIILASLISCDDSKSLSKKKNASNNNSYKSSQPYESRYIYIKDVTKYDKSFISGLIKYGSEQNKYLKLVDDILTVDNENYSLSSDIESNKIYIFTRNEKGKKIKLNLVKYNYSSLKYDLKIISDDRTILEKSGLVTLNSCFFLGAESDDNEETGISFFVTTYRYDDPAGYIYISVGENDNGLLQARLELNVISDLPVLYLNTEINLIE